MLTREKVWLRAWTAVANTINGKEQDCLRFADACLKAFDERFPPRTPPEALFCGKPLSELNDTERADFRRTLSQVPVRARDSA